jgi:hypothetical protein
MKSEIELCCSRPSDEVTPGAQRTLPRDLGELDGEAATLDPRTNIRPITNESRSRSAVSSLPDWEGVRGWETAARDPRTNVRLVTNEYR